MRITRWVVGSCLGLSALSATAATIFSFSNFSNCTGLQVNGNAACTSGVLRLTPATFSQAGSAFSTTTVQLGAGASFSTFFTFQMSSPGGSSDSDGLGADGIVFVVQPVSSTVGGLGGGIGYQGIPNSLGIEFDTWNNGVPNDPDGNHVGVDLAGSVASVVTMPIPTRMNDGNIWSAWVDYNGTVVELRVSQTNVRPATPTLSFAVDLATLLGTTQAFVGFTSGTGAAFENHDILTWQFNSGFEPIGGAAAAPVNVPVLSPFALVLAGLLLAFAAATHLRARQGEA